MSEHAQNITRILFVCMGNICRSPTAHAVMQNLVDGRGLSHTIEVASAGTHAYHVGEQSDPRSRALANEKGVDMEFIRAQKIAITDYDYYHYILAMDHDNLELINYYAPENYSAKVALFLSFANELGRSTEPVVSDPYYGGDNGFELAFDLVNIGCEAILDSITE